MTETNENENDELLKYNLLQLETKEIISECYFPTNNDTSTTSSNYKTLHSLQEYIETIKNILEKLPSHKSLQTLNKEEYLKSDLYQKYKSKWTVQYDKSMYDGIDIIGSYKNNTMTTVCGNGNIVPTVDLVFYVNDGFWKDKDYLNHRYFDKRNLMMLHIAHYLSKKKFTSVGDVELSYFRNDMRKLAVLTCPKKKKFQIRILLGTKSFPFNHSRLFPNCNNMKESKSPTRLYNHAIIEDCSFTSNEKLVVDTISDDITNFEESLVLLKVWSSKHGLRNAHDGLSSYELTMIVVYCYRTKRISRGMTNLQVFSIVLHFLLDLFGDCKCITMPGETSEQEERYEMEYKHPLIQGYKENQNDMPIFLNQDRTMNIFTRLTSTSCTLIHHHVQHTCSTQKEWNAQSLFLQSKRFWNIFDVYLQIPLFTASNPQIPLNGVDIGDAKEYTVQCICYILKHALNDRVTLIRPYTTGNGCNFLQSNIEDIATWSLSSKPPSFDFIIGLQFSSNEARQVDKCSNKELFQFIYGDRVELRRFRDGTIHSSVVWNNSTYLGIIQDITSHVLKLHFDVGYKLYNSSLLSFIEGSRDYKDIIHVYNSLTLLLMNHHTKNDTMPLSIDSVTTTSPILRYSSYYPSLPYHQLGSTRKDDYNYSVITQEPIVLHISFQGSKSWPRDIKAIQASKCAMLISLANTIEYLRDEEKLDQYQFKHVSVSSTHVDFGYKGYSFRVYVLANEELKVLRQLKVPTADAIALYRELHLENVVKPLHHSTIHALHTKYPSASGTVRLLQRWLASHLLSSNLFPLDILELLVAYVYIHYSTSLHSLPKTPISGFVRFLYFISTFDFQYNPLVLNFEEEGWNLKDLIKIQKLFKSIRSEDYTLGPPCYIVTSMEYALIQNDSTLQYKNQDWLVSSIHTQKLERLVWNRFVELSKRCYKFLMSPLVHHKSLDSILPIFQESSASLQKYHVLLRVNSDLIHDTSCSSTMKEDDGYSFEDGLKLRKLGPKIFRTKRIKYKNLQDDGDTSVIHGWEPIKEFVSYLQSKYNQYCLFFYNQFTPHVIGILFRPDAISSEPVAISARNCEYKRPLDELGVFNVQDVVREISCIGEGIVEDVKILIDLPVCKRAKVEEEGDSSNSNDVDSSDSTDVDSDDEN